MINHMTTSTLHRCTVCQLTQAEVFVTVPQAPVICNVLWPTRQQAMSARRVDISLAFCQHCGHIFNPQFDPSIMDYNEAYENSLHFSPRFRQYAEGLAQELISRYQLQRKQVIDIGGGKGDFLRLLCQLGDNQGLNIDPSYAPSPEDEAKDQRLTFIQDYYSERYAHLPADLIYSRHTLEHVQFPIPFIQTVRRTIGERYATAVFFEVPNARFTLDDLAVWDIIYEHCSYFTSQSLDYLFQSCGFTVQDVRSTFAGQFLCIEAAAAATPASPPACSGRSVGELAQEVAAFAEKYRQKVQKERAMLAEFGRAGQKVVVWGSGSKGITFLNTLQLQGQIEYAVDINPRKEGMFITGVGQQIVPPTFLQSYRPDVVIIMNPIYQDEIRGMLAGFNLHPELVVV
jgi:hypothetical protein